VRREEAEAIAERGRVAHEVPPAGTLADAEERWIEVAGVREEEADRVRDTRVWAVRFQHGNGWTELAVEDATGGIVRVRRSR